MTGKFRIYSALLFVFLLCAACRRKEEPSLDVTTDSVLFMPSGGDGAFEIRTNVSWLCRISPASAGQWLSLERSAGKSGVHTVNVSALRNETDGKKSATIYISGGGVSRTVEVVQKSTAGVEVSQSLFNIRQKGDAMSVAVYANAGLELNIEGDWIHNTTEPYAGRTITLRRFTFTIDENPRYDPRDGKIIFSDVEGNTSKEVVIHQDAVRRPISATPAALEFTAAAATDYLTVEAAVPSWSVDVTAGSEWCSAEKYGTGKVKVRAKTNLDDERDATIRLAAGEYVQEIILVQQAFDDVAYYGDRQVLRLQQAATGNGVDLILLGDGYTLNEMGRDGGGKYETDMRAAADSFFSVYPYSAYRDWFNVYMVTAVSEEAGLSTRVPKVAVDTKFETIWQGTTATIECNDVKVKEYASAVTALTGKQLRETTVIMPVNKDVYAGTCLMWTDGFSVAMIAAGPKFGSVVVHEAGGHGFAKLADEYVYNEAAIPLRSKDHVSMMKGFGFYANIDFSDNILATSWSGFANQPEYTMVGTYPGAYMYRQGIWRPEQNSCMNDNTLYFNAPSRWAQVKRIHELAGVPYSFEQFLFDDEIPPYPAAARSAMVYPEPFTPTGPPVVFTTPSAE